MYISCYKPNLSQIMIEIKVEQTIVGEQTKRAETTLHKNLAIIEYDSDEIM